MNYIKSLQEQLAEREQQRIQAQGQVEIFLTHLQGPKFSGFENGERKDWISTADVVNWLRDLRMNLLS